ncbi:hypothetical protein D3C71_1150990 [compost metagenome]
MTQETQIAAAAEHNPVKAGTLHGQRTAHAAVDGTLRAEGQAVAQFQQAAGTHGERAIGHLRRIAKQYARSRRAIGGEVHPHTGKAHIRRCQVHSSLRIGLWRQREGTGVQTQALPHGHIDVAVERHQAVGQQPQMIESPARQQARRVQPRLAVAQAFRAFARLQGGAQRAVRPRRQHQFARHLHGLARDALAPSPIQRRFQRDVQRSARGVRAACARDECTVQMQAVVRAERNAAAVAAQLHRADSAHIHDRARAGRVQHGARTHDHIRVRGLRGGAVVIDLAADHDDAARIRHAIAAALHIHARLRAAGHVQHRLFADPDRPVVHLAVGDLRGLGHIDVAQAELADVDLAAGRPQGAQHRDLARATQLDGLPRIHVHLRAATDDQLRVGIDAGKR